MTTLAVSVLASLAAVLLCSGVAKLLVPDTGRTLLSTTAVPSVLGAGRVQGMLPWVEIALAAALLFLSGPLLLVAELAATTLFAGFTAVVLRGTRTPDPASCGCFGGLSRAPVTHRTVVRNLAFTLVAVLALVLTAAGAAGPAVDVPWWTVAAGAVPAVLALLVLWSERPGGSTADPHDVARVPPLPAAASPSAARPGGAPARVPTPGGAPGADGDGLEEYERLPIPYAGLTDARATAVTLRGLARTQARALVAVSPTCGSCTPVIARLTALTDRLGPVAVHAVVSGEEQLGEIPEQLRSAALVDRERGLATVFEQPGTPWAVVLGADGLLAGGPVAGAGPVLELLGELAERFGA